MQIDETNPADIEQEAPAIEDVEDTTQVADEPDNEPDDLDADDVDADADPDAEEGEGEPEEIEYAEIELNGKTYQIPAELKDGYLMQADYTRKTQEVAEHRRELEAQRQQVEAMSQASKEEMQTRAELIGINQRLEQYSQVDWNAWSNEDPIAAQQGYIEYQQLERQARDKGQKLQEAEQHRTEWAKQDTAKRLQETRQFAEKSIPGWTPEIDAKVTEFSTKVLGFPVDTLLGAYTPQVYRALHLAWKGYQSEQAASTKATARPKPSAQIKPLSKIAAKGNATARKSLEEMPMEEYAEYRNRQERRRASR